MRWLLTAAAATVAAGCVTSRFVYLDDHYPAARRASPPELFTTRVPKPPFRGVGWVEVFHDSTSDLSAVDAEAVAKGQDSGCELLVDEAVLRQRPWLVMVGTDDPNADPDVNRRRFLCAFYRPPPAGESVPSVPPLVSVAQADSMDVSREALSRYVRSRNAAIQGCYQRELGQNPTLAGKVVVRFTITKMGRAGDIGIESDTMGNEAVGTCIKSVIGGWVFPFKPEADVPVAYPFVFSVARPQEQ